MNAHRETARAMIAAVDGPKMVQGADNGLHLTKIEATVALRALAECAERWQAEGESSPNQLFAWANLNDRLRADLQRFIERDA